MGDAGVTEGHWAKLPNKPDSASVTMQSQAPGALVQRFGRRALADRWHRDRQKVAGGTHVVSCEDAEDHGAGLRAIPLQKRRCPGLCQRTRDGSLVRRLVGALEKLSIVLARENGAMIARATSWQQAVATRP